MPLYDFKCTSCSHTFEELAFAGDDEILCPRCGAPAERLVSAPSPLKTGAFPFKIGPRPAWLDNKNLNRNAPCHGGCASCGGGCPDSGGVFE